MEQTLSILIEKIIRGPAVLFLGQNYLKIETGQDDYLDNIIQKYFKGKSKSGNYFDLFQDHDLSDIESMLAWMNDRSEKLTIPEWLKTISGISWGHVYTSAIDTLWYRSFRNEWRELHPIFEEKYKPIDIRNKNQLHCTFLFGNVNRGNDEERPPLERFEWLKKKQEALTLARRLNEIVTPMGILIIEGYSGSSDWFSLDEFLPILDSLNIGQVHLFSADKNDLENNDLQKLINAGKVIIHQENLASILVEADYEGLLKLGDYPFEESGEHSIQCEKKTLRIPLEIWKAASNSALVLDDELLLPPKKVSKDRIYQEFIEFLQNSSIIPVWSAYSRGFSFERNYEKELLNRTQKWLSNYDKHNEPIILHGQSGTGKTVSLGRLAYEIRHQSCYPVLFIERKSTRPNYSDLDYFCKWAEDNGANSTLIIWDGMLEPEQYYDLLTYLLGRGRKVTLVGSSYKVSEEIKFSEKIKKKSNFIEALSKITPDEFSRFLIYLKTVDQDLNLDYLSDKVTDINATFFVTLFRLLPHTRSKLRTQLNQEVISAQQKIIRKTDKSDTRIPSTTLGHALWEAGMLDLVNPLDVITKTLDGEKLNRMELLIGLIMVPGQFGIRVPIELLLRSLQMEWMDNLEENLNVDIFRWDEDNVGNILVSSRHPLEARLIVQSRLGGPKSELEYAKYLLLAIRGDDIADSLEIQFAVDLVRSLGPNGQFSQIYAPYFLDVSQFLTELREERGTINTRMMLQEATLIREAVSWHDRVGNPIQNAIDLLQKAEKILNSALEILEKDKKNDRQRGNILVELGTTLASKNRLYIENPNRLQISLKTFNDARDYLVKAVVLNPEDFHPTDVLIWMSDNIIKAKILSEVEQNELKADLQYIISSIDPENLSPEQMERYYQKQDLVGELVNNIHLSENAFQALEQIGSKVGYFLKTTKIVGRLPAEEITDSVMYDKIQSALNYIESQQPKFSGDGKCLDLLLKLWWFNKTRKPILYGERQTVKFEIDDWLYVWKLTSELIQIGGLYSTPTIKYINGISTFHLGQIENALVVFRELEREVDYIKGRRRILRSYLASTEAGNPRVFHGQVAWINERGDRGEVYVEELTKNIHFLPLDFYTGRTLRKGDSLGDFHIAFNFIGALADPFSFNKPQKNEQKK